MRFCAVAAASLHMADFDRPKSQHSTIQHRRQCAHIEKASLPFHLDQGCADFFLNNGRRKTEWKMSKRPETGIRNSEREWRIFTVCRKPHSKRFRKLFYCFFFASKTYTACTSCTSSSERETPRHDFVILIIIVLSFATANSIDKNNCKSFSYCNNVQSLHFFLIYFLLQLFRWLFAAAVFK